VRSLRAVQLDFDASDLICDGKDKERASIKKIQ
jgi:hypothetical protein